MNNKPLTPITYIQHELAAHGFGGALNNGRFRRIVTKRLATMPERELAEYTKELIAYWRGPVNSDWPALPYRGGR